MKPRPFDYVRPDTVDEAVALLAEHGDDARVLAGGQTLLAMLNLRVVEPAVLVDITRIPELDVIREVDGKIEVGAAVTQNRLMAWPALAKKLPLLAAALPFVGHFQTRNKGTVCGSIAHADPTSEIPLSLAVLEGEVVLRSRRGTRVLAAERIPAGHAGHRARGRRADHRRSLSGRDRAASRFAKWRAGMATSPSSPSPRSPRRQDSIRIGVAGMAERPAVRRIKRGRRSGIAMRSNGWPGSSRATRTCMRPPRMRRDLLRGIAPVVDRGGDTMRRVNKGERARLGLTLNGRKMSGEAEPRMLLSDFLRHVLGATGTHVGCEHGVCGCCTVLIDGAAVRSCLTLAVQAEGRAVTTVESLAGADGKLNALQQAFQNNHALQCGFCTPGILMSFTDFLARNPDPSEAEVVEVLSGHLCRCTGYAGIVAAVLEAAGHGNRSQ